MSSISGSVKCSSGPESSTVLSEFDTEYACCDHAMVRQVVQNAVHNYFSAPCTSPSHMTLCIDFTEGAPIPSNSTATVRYQAPLVQISVQRKFDSRKSDVETKDDEVPDSLTTEKEETGTSEISPVLNAAKKLPVFTIKEEEDLKPTKAVIKTLKSKIPPQMIDNLKCVEKKRAEEKIFEYLTFTNQKFMSQEMLMEWRKKHEEDKRQLYSDQQVTTKDSSSSPMRAHKDLTVTFRETGINTKDERTDGWGQPAGILDFESRDIRGNMSKAVQIRGSLPNTM